MNSQATKPCATCGAKSNFQCVACSMVEYCSAGCRDRHSREHQEKCGGLLQKLVERIGESLREMFYVFSERAFDTKVVGVAKGTDAILISEGSNNVQQSRQALFPFPVMPTADVRDRHAVLCANRSEHAVAYLHDFLAQMLQGELSSLRLLYNFDSHKVVGVPLSRIEEGVARMKHAPKAGVLRCADKNGDRRAQDTHRHRFVKLYASFHNRRWVLDPAGAIYGVQVDAMAAGNYGNSRVDASKELPQTYQFGYHKGKMHDFAQVRGLLGLPQKVLFVAAEYLQAGIDEWTLQSRLTLPQMLRSSDSEYKDCLISLRSCVHESMSEMTGKPECQQAIREALGA